MKEQDNHTNIDSVAKLINELNSIIISKVDNDINFSKKFFENLTRGVDIKENFKMLKKYF